MNPTDFPKYDEFVRAADAAYVRFAPFADWLSCSIDPVRWERFEADVKVAKESDKNRQDRALKIVQRMAAIETGAIEGLYELDTGFTLTTAHEGILLSAPPAGGQPAARERLIVAQIAAYDYVMDFATRRAPITEAWIRQLHEVICENQDTYTVITSAGSQEQQLPKGQYKTQPNHVLLEGNRIHSYAPVLETPAEMQRLYAELTSDAFQSAPPAVQAAFAHHAFVCIHPFSDGNGRVARALASVFFMRSHSIPLLILHEQKGEYLTALRSTDAGNRQALVDFMISRAKDAVQLLLESLLTADVVDTATPRDRIASLYVTAGGYTHGAIDDAANRLIAHIGSLVHGKTQSELSSVSGANTSVGGFSLARNPDELRPGNRSPIGVSNAIRIDVNTPGPAESHVQFVVFVEVPKRGAADDRILILCQNTQDELQIEVAETLPAILPAAGFRLQMFADRIAERIMQQSATQARGSLRNLGYY